MKLSRRVVRSLSVGLMGLITFGMIVVLGLAQATPAITVFDDTISSTITAATELAQSDASKHSEISGKGFLILPKKQTSSLPLNSLTLGFLSNLFSQIERAFPLNQRSSGNITLNTFCQGIANGKAYDGIWKKVIGNPNKAKCKEGANGNPGKTIHRNVCNIQTINDGTIFNATVMGSTTCQKI